MPKGGRRGAASTTVCTYEVRGGRLAHLLPSLGGSSSRLEYANYLSSLPNARADRVFEKDPGGWGKRGMLAVQYLRIASPIALPVMEIEVHSEVTFPH